MLTDIEIAQSIQPKNIKEIARNAGIDEKYLEQYVKGWLWLLDRACEILNTGNLYRRKRDYR